jgi:choline dehydrogenase-like flavoprotein
VKIDASQLTSAQVFKTQVAVIGAGAAGIAIAREFQNSKTQVLLLEAGGYEYDQVGQSYYESESVVTNTESLIDDTYPFWSRLRYFGGSTGHWGGWSCPLEDYDFHKKSWISGSGWPITRDELIPYYHRACEVIEIPRFDFQNQSQSPIFKPSPDYDQIFADCEADSRLMQRYFAYSPPTRFGLKYREELDGSNNITVMTHANVVRIDMDESHQRIKTIIFKNPNGLEFEVHADVFVLACGGLENPRLLLNSWHQSAGGLGNQNDLVGRCFLEHPHSELGILMNARGQDWLNSFVALGYGESKRIFATTPEFQLKNQSLPFSCQIMPSPQIPEGHRSIDQLRRLVARDPDQTSFCSLYVRADMEPNRNNRVFLGQEKDQLGLNKISMNVSFSKNDLDSIRVSTEAVMEHLSFLGLGRSKLLMPTEDQWPGSVWIGCHHMGTTRMASSPRDGVVDADCRLHGLDNFFVAGSSVFPTGGYGNPTLTLVALSLRLSDHLKKRVL